MMSVRLAVRADGGTISWNVDDWTVLVALAALSAEPETQAEFLTAVRRYQPNHHWEETGQAAADSEKFTAGAGNWCLIDLPSRSVVAGGEFELPERGGAFQATGDDALGDGFPIVWIDTPPEWLFQTDADDWQSVIAERRQAFEGCQRVDTRSVLFRRPMLEFIAKRVASAATPEALDERRYEQIRAIHADWLMTTRDDLLGNSPREVLLCHQEQVGWDIQHRSEQWSRQGFAPPPLDVNSAAYRFGGYGTTAIVLYFDLLRSLLDEAWLRVTAGETNCDVLIERLADHRDRWLNQPPEDSSTGLTCDELIESERRRMPVTGDRSHLDCDCPICQAEADGAFGAGPMFMFFDGHHLELEDDFAFSMIASREVWETEQQEFACYRDEMDRRRTERDASVDEPESVWNSNSVDWDKLLCGGGPLQAAKLAIGFPLAELVANLRERNADRTTIDTLNTAFAMFRRADGRLAEQSAGTELCECLENVAAAYPELVARSSDLQSRLDEVLRSAVWNNNA